MQKVDKVRLDDECLSRGFFANRDEASRAILAKEVKVEGQFFTIASTSISKDSKIEVIRAADERGGFVSRGGVKLQAAIDAFHVDVTDKKCLDIGSSTGGFTDCLLKAGAAWVSAVDVNYGQLDYGLRIDARVHVFERTNIKKADPAHLGAPFDVIVIDVSFIGLASLAGVIAKNCKTGTILLALVKPQFESKHTETVAGVVVDENVRVRTIEEVKTALAYVGFEINGVIESPIHGKKAGNIEYMLCAKYL